MDTTPRPTLRRPEIVAAADQAGTPEPARALTVTVVYQLSEAGRKASLLAGGDGKQVQQLQVQVPASRLHLVNVDPQGRARLKLRPRFHEDGDHRIIRTDAIPVYDAPPSLDDLFREAARNHELERAYQAERNAVRAKRQDAQRQRREAIAMAFLEDKSQRALVHPAPSPKRCTLKTPDGRVIFDVATDQGLAREVAPEAHRRFRADLAAKKERNLRERAAQLALHEEKKRYIAAWIAEHGTEDQKERQAAGMLPMNEAVEAIAEDAFRPLARLKRWRSSRPGVRPPSPAAKTASSQEWGLFTWARQRLPQAETKILTRYDGHERTGRLQTVLVEIRSGPLALRREFRLSEATIQGPTPDVKA